MTARAIRTTCPYCGVGCGVLAQARDDGTFEISGDPDHPANFGKLCSKGSALGETFDRRGRLLYPHIRNERTSWDAALDHVAQGFRRIIDRDGPGAVAMYVSGQLLTEDYYVANKLMKGYIGTANIDTNSRLCMSSAVAGHKRAFGEDLVPVCYDDLALADLIVLVGSNTAWCHPILFQRIAAARQERPNMKIVVIDPRRTATCELADLHLPVRAGTDVWLFNGLLAFLHQHGVVATEFIARSTSGVDRALQVAQDTAGDLRGVATACGMDERALAEFYRLFARTEKTLTIFSQGVNQSSAGTDKVNSIINCHLLTGRIGRPGMGPFSVTGQPNAMGGREVGGLATTLAAHMDLDVADHRRAVQEFWNSPVIANTPGLKAVDLFNAIHDRRVKAVWIMATNPIVSLPAADRAREALRRCELVVVSDCVQHTDTTALAHVLLPAAGWGEKDGTVTNSERRISRQRAFLPAPGEAKPDWWIISQVARRLGYAPAFAFETAHEIFAEHAALSGVQTRGSARVRHQRSQLTEQPRLRSTAAGSVAHSRCESSGDRTAVERRALLPRRRQGALHSNAAARPRQRARRRVSAGTQHRSRPRPVAHDDPHGLRTAPDRSHARALRRHARAGRAARRHARRRPGARRHAPGIDRRAPAHQRRDAARDDLRADPLEQHVRLGRTRRRARQSSRRSGFR